MTRRVDMRLRSIALSAVVLGAVVVIGVEAARGPIEEAIENGVANGYRKDECVWRRVNDRDSCPDPDVKVILYTGFSSRRQLDSRETDWLRHDYDASKDNVFLVHGYAGGDDTLPISVLRDAYLRNGSYNVFMVDWGALCAAPCYPAAVSNLRPVARCLADTLTKLRNVGLAMAKTTCVGHSLGAHLCGIMANYLLFRMHRIIGLDPARPLIRAALVNRLDSGDAEFVEVIHTNAGYYGEATRTGHVDFCVNGGKGQPFCERTANYELCSHVWVVCFMAQSIDNDGTRSVAHACSRRCPSGPKIAQKAAVYVPMGQHTPAHTRGSFCLNTNLPPYCPMYENGHGDERCCVEGSANVLPSFKRRDDDDDGGATVATNPRV